MNLAWARSIVRGLRAGGVTRAVVCPGGRSASLAVALAEADDIEAIPVLDERSAAFVALGVGRGSGRPAVALCTSGSAGAHMLAAVIEADHAGVPMIVLTADRPPEARLGGHRQTTEQTTFFAGRTRWFADLGCPAEAAAPDWPRSAAEHAVQLSMGPHPGPVHLNAPFREPVLGGADD